MPSSLLTHQRPDIWRSAVVLAETITGILFVDKVPMPDGTVWACGGTGGTGGGVPAYAPPKKKDRVAYIKFPEEGDPELDDDNEHEPKKAVAVPDGAMEWLLHEVGHWVASTPEERALPNYGVSSSTTGHDGERELQAWAFEEIVLAPFGPARSFAPPTQRDGAAFEKSGPMPAEHMHHAEREIARLGLDAERWRVVWGEWVAWGRRNNGQPWRDT
jgi:hypothetical protein